MPDDARHEPTLTRRGVLAGAAALAGANALLRPRIAVGAGPATLPAARHAAVERGLDVTAALGRDREGRFGLMFKKLDAFTPPDDLLHGLAERMAEPAAAGAELDNDRLPSGYTYLGQFIVHDITADRTPLGEQQVDPHGVVNFDSPRLDLGVVYGGGPAANPELYVPDGSGRLRLEDRGGVLDLPRRPDGSAYIGDARNDENQLVLQLHILFLRVHNRLVDGGLGFADAQRLTRWHYQWLVVNDLLERLAGRATIDRYFERKNKQPPKFKREFYKPTSRQRPMMPLEFSLAAFRFGHSIVRPLYRLNDQLAAPVFTDDPSAEDLRGSRALDARHALDWRRFFPAGGDTAGANLARRIDTRLAPGLFHLPVPQVVPATPTPVIVSLAERNLLRGKRLGLPSGQQVARTMGVTPLEAAELGLTDPRWSGGSPLWFYVLAEAERRQDGRMLGDVGGRIVTEVLLGLLDTDPGSFMNARDPFLPQPPVTSQGERFGMADLVAFARGS